MTNKIKPRIILNRCLTDYYTYFFLLPIIYISGCEGDQGPAGSAGGVTELIVNVQNKMYTTGNPDWITIFYDDPNTDDNTTVIFVGEKLQSGIWVNAIRYIFNGEHVHFCCNINIEENMKEDFGYDGKTGNAALIYDSGHYLKGKEIKLLYIP